MTLPLFVEAAWLMEHAADDSIRIIDTRSRPHGAAGANELPGRERFAAGHIPGAIYLDYAEDLHDLATPYAARVAPADRFAAVLGELGIGDRHTIVAYDEGTVPYAARFVWMCEYYGHNDVHVLAGGLPQWIAAGGAVTTVPTHYAPETFTASERPQLRAPRDEVIAISSGASDAQLLETQRDGTYALRSHDIPRAVRLSASDLLEDARGGRIAAPEKIAALVRERGLDPHKRTVVSCGSGVGASGAYLALREAGFTDLAVYDGSWMEWSHDKLPVVERKDAGHA
jgi:thiosulfate/3-mercaptopyruvate sulfurtransferase